MAATCIANDNAARGQRRRPPRRPYKGFRPRLQDFRHHLGLYRIGEKEQHQGKSICSLALKPWSGTSVGELVRVGRSVNWPWQFGQLCFSASLHGGQKVHS